MNNPRLFLPLQSRVEIFFVFFLGGPAHSLQATSRVGPPIVYKLQAVKKFIFIFYLTSGILWDITGPGGLLYVFCIKKI